MKEDEILAQLAALRQDVETQTAINIVEGINSAETLAALVFWMRKKRTPTAKEVQELERVARERWTGQVRHMIGLAKKDSGGLDASLATMLSQIQGPEKKKRAAKPKRRR
jgi:hypothetical protein